jgi:hypothetical protein
MVFMFDNLNLLFTSKNFLLICLTHIIRYNSTVNSAADQEGNFWKVLYLSWVNKTKQTFQQQTTGPATVFLIWHYSNTKAVRQLLRMQSSTRGFNMPNTPLVTRSWCTAHSTSKRPNSKPEPDIPVSAWMSVILLCSVILWQATQYFGSKWNIFQHWCLFALKRWLHQTQPVGRFYFTCKATVKTNTRFVAALFFTSK